MSIQSSRHLFLIEPAEFHFNPDTAATNQYQHNDTRNHDLILTDAIAEFRRFRNKLVEAGVYVTTFKGKPGCPDHVFANWFSTHADKTMNIYPMLAKSRQDERVPAMIEALSRTYEINLDMRAHEEQGLYLEGVSSIVLDRVNKQGYAALSPRTDEALVRKWGSAMGYEVHAFETENHLGKPVYHSDLIIHIGTEFAGICLECILPQYRDKIRDTLSKTHEVIELSFEQLEQFCGNALEVRGKDNEPYLAISESAFYNLNQKQRAQYLQFIKGFISSDIPTIERYGGGSARCMIQELF